MKTSANRTKRATLELDRSFCLRVGQMRQWNDQQFLVSRLESDPSGAFNVRSMGSAGRGQQCLARFTERRAPLALNQQG